jgi:hypothetical protein
MAVWLLALCSSWAVPAERFLVPISVRGWVYSGAIMLIFKINFNGIVTIINIIEVQTRDFPGLRAVRPLRNLAL